jgi:hypothetical protein
MLRFYAVHPVLRMADDGNEETGAGDPELNILETGNASGDVEGEEEDGEGTEDESPTEDGEAEGEPEEENT